MTGNIGAHHLPRLLLGAFAAAALIIAACDSGPEAARPSNPVQAQQRQPQLQPQAGQPVVPPTPVSPPPTVKMELPTPDPSAPVVTPYFANYFGMVTINGSQAADGILVEAFDPRGNLVGRSKTVQGYYPYTRVYGEEATSNPPIPGMKPGETVTFKVNGALASTNPFPAVWKADPVPARIDLVVPAGGAPTSAQPGVAPTPAR